MSETAITEERSFARVVEPKAAQRPESGTPLSLPLDVLDDNPYQPRLSYDEEKLEELCASIRNDGLLQPIVVRRAIGGRFQVLAGHRRLRAFRRLRDRSDVNEERRFAAIPALLKADATDEEMARLALNENLHRDDLVPTEAAAALARYRDMAGLRTTKDLAKATGLNENRVKRLLRLNELPEFIKAAVSPGLLVELPSEGAESRRARRSFDMMAALEFGRLYRVLFAREPKKAEARTATLIEKALREAWGFRRIEAAVDKLLDGDDRANAAGPAPEATTPKPSFSDDGTTLIIRVGALATMAAEDRLALLTRLRTIVTALSAST